ncbi:late expression factor 3 [Samia cynthia nucleopolyhedrovirus]|uniref:Late expression factor 3 n=2 Tax=Antheraea pernyi nuclear polyhedrosis virus TaxID=161494 RepID=A8C668_NPVAP|nr:late expression factor 3 [Antheraea pernyi nucleopolyhedrovirus]AWD33605.1 late expression factor 3 [Antheraea proylei nucleopolyhedrovirus]BBD50542.1 late expression factor 3 [Antheraea yamamai nucleopolyhedrovirus]BBD50694.1 late expression factor 3 [Samia cynthia nucleopolyhedrovirus]AYW35432.1 lef-3 [Antheraea proylei nucleopolyhedrovirus]
MATKREHGNETGAEPAKKKVKENYKRVIGKLLNKTTISIDNQRYYTFRFLADNKTEAYYGDAQCFKDLVENDCYSVNLNFVKTKFKEWIQINDYEKCESILEEAAPVKQVLTRADFENEEMVNVLAKLKCVFKRLAANNYKMVFEINMADAGGTVRVEQVECFANAKMLANVAKSFVKNCDDANELMDFYFKNSETLFNVHGVRCQYTSKGQSAFLNWVAGQSTRLEAAGDADSDDHLNLKCSSATNNISRANKHLVCVRLAQFKADQKESDSGKESFSVQFKAADCDNEEPRWNKCVYYVDSKADEVAQSDTSALDKLAMDFDQLTTCLADGLTKAVLFVTVDNSNPNNMNMLGLLKYDEEDREYSFV